MENCAVRGKLTVRSGMRILREGDDPASRLCLSGPPLCPIPPLLLSSWSAEENVQEREFMIFSFLSHLTQNESEALRGQRTCPRPQD